MSNPTLAAVPSDDSQDTDPATDPIVEAVRVGISDVDSAADETAEDIQSARLMGRAARRKQRRAASKLRVAEKLADLGIVTAKRTRTGGVSVTLLDR